jgi:hypothetical protein
MTQISDPLVLVVTSSSRKSDLIRALTRHFQKITYLPVTYRSGIHVHVPQSLRNTTRAYGESKALESIVVLQIETPVRR